MSVIEIIHKYQYGMNMGIELSCALLCLIFALAMMSMFKTDREARAFSIYNAMAGFSFLFDLLAYMYSQNPKTIAVLYACNFMYYLLTLAYVIFFYIYIAEHIKACYGISHNVIHIKWMTVLASVAVIVWGSSIWNHLIYDIDENGVMSVTGLTYISGSVFIPILLAAAVSVFKARKIARMRETVLYMLFIIIYITVAIVDAANMTSLHCIAAAVFSCLILIFVEIDQERQLSAKETQVILSELNALRLQMNPHYIYNTLASIDGLIVFAPDEARKLIANFVKHLRGTYLKEMPHMMSFDEELTNLEYYVNVEKTRFPNLNVEYDIETTDFEIPPLTVQPLLENAIKHGICAKENAKGTVTLSTFESADGYHVKIADDGVGFDVNATKDDGRSHIGIDNTKKRLELLCNGRLEVNSIPGVGTAVEIIIPKDEE